MADLFARLGITEDNPVLLHRAAEPRMGGRYQACFRCRFILQDMRTGQERADGVTETGEERRGLLPVWDGLVGYDHASEAAWYVAEKNAGGYRECRPKCGVSEDGVSCEVVSVYDATFDDCAFCLRLGALLCLGHPMCVEHGALVRGDQMVWDFAPGDPDTGRDVVVDRIGATWAVAS